MTENDYWGLDPSVRAMRGLFSRMEAAQEELIERIGLSPFDGRLRYCRDEARALFERTLCSNRAGAEGLDDKERSALYVLCLSWALDRRGIRVPEWGSPDNNRLRELIMESLK